VAVRKRSLCTSGGIAKARTSLTIAADRLSCNQEEFQQMRRELKDVLLKYLDLENNNYEIQLEIVYRTKRGVQDVKTIQIK
jgi:cell division topological specificity factor MinE